MISKPTRNTLLLSSLVVLAGVLAYLPIRDAGFVFDDRLLIENNPAITDLSNLPLFFSSKDARIPWESSNLQSDIYRPLQTTSYAVSHALFGANPGAYHLEDLLLHLVNALLVFLLIRRLTGSGLAGWATALLFTVHPVQVEAVSYLAGRSDQLMLGLLLLSMLLYLRSRGPGCQRPAALTCLSLTCFAASLLCKEMSISLPAMLFLHALLIDRATVRRAVSASGLFFVLAGLFLIVRTIGLGKLGQTGMAAPLDLALNMLRVFAEYLRLLVYPAELTFYHQVGQPGADSVLSLVISFVVACLYLIACVLAWRRNRTLCLLLCCYAVSLVPVSNIIPMKTIMQERFLYLPSVFLLGVAGWGFAVLLEKTSKKRGPAGRLAVTAALLLAVLLLARTTYHRNQAWESEQALVTRELELHPELGSLHYDLGWLLFQNRDLEAATRSLETALALKLSRFHESGAHDVLGNIAVLGKNDPLAEQHYLAALALTPDHAHSRNSLGGIFFRRKQYARAREQFEQAVQLMPRKSRFHANLAAACERRGDRAKAIKHWRISLTIDPDQPELRAYLNRIQ